MRSAGRDPKPVKRKELRSRMAMWLLVAGLVFYLVGLAAGLVWAVRWLFG